MGMQTELELGATEDPRALVAGDPAALAATQQRLGSMAEAFGRTAAGLTRVDVGSWQGEAADAFRAAYPGAPAQWSAAHHAFTAASAGWNAYQQVVDWAQDRAKVAVARHQAGVTASRDAVTRRVEAVARYNAQFETARRGEGPAPQPLPPFVDPGPAQIAAAQDVLTSARQQRDRVADGVAATLREAAALAPDPPSGWDALAADVADEVRGDLDEVGRVLGGVAEGVEGVVHQLRTLNPADPWNSRHPAAYLAGVSAAAAGVVTAAAHPARALADLAGPGWVSDPERAAGRMVPGVLLAAVAGGGALTDRVAVREAARPDPAPTSVSAPAAPAPAVSAPAAPASPAPASSPRPETARPAPHAVPASPAGGRPPGPVITDPDPASPPFTPAPDARPPGATPAPGPVGAGGSAAADGVTAGAGSGPGGVTGSGGAGPMRGPAADASAGAGPSPALAAADARAARDIGAAGRGLPRVGADLFARDVAVGPDAVPAAAGRIPAARQPVGEAPQAAGPSTGRHRADAGEADAGRPHPATPTRDARGRPVVPAGFDSVQAYRRFGRVALRGLADAGFPDARVIFQGSSVTGVKYTTAVPFDLGRRSDYDIALAAPDLYAAAQRAGVPVRRRPARTRPLSPDDLRSLGLLELQDELTRVAGRKVSFMVYPSADAALGRSPGIEVRSR